MTLLFVWFGVFGVIGNALASRYVDRFGADRAVGFALVPDGGLAGRLALGDEPHRRRRSSSCRGRWRASTQSMQQARLGAAAPALARGADGARRVGDLPRAGRGASSGGWLIAHHGYAPLGLVGVAWLVGGDRAQRLGEPRAASDAPHERDGSRRGASARRRPKSNSDLFFAFNRLALQGFGGVLAVAQRELVERKGWLSREEFVEMLALSQVLPGPNVVNLGADARRPVLRPEGRTRRGRRHARRAARHRHGADRAYAEFSRLAFVSGALRGMGAVAAGLIIATAIRLMTTLGSNRLGLPLAARVRGPRPS